MSESHNSQIGELQERIDVLKERRSAALHLKTDKSFDEADEVTILIWNLENQINNIKREAQAFTN